MNNEKLELEEGATMVNGTLIGVDDKIYLDGAISQIKFLQGKVLTIIDAAIGEPRQNKAVKDIINQAFSAQIKHLFSIASSNEVLSLAGKRMTQQGDIDNPYQD